MEIPVVTVPTDKKHKELSMQASALIAGLSLLVMAVLASYANFSVIKQLSEIADPSEFFSSLMTNLVPFRIGILFFILVAIFDILVAWALYYFLKPVHRGFSMLTAVFRIVYAALLSTAVFKLINIIQYIEDYQLLTAFNREQVSSQLMITLKFFQGEWDISMILFGLHLVLLGYLLFRSGYVPKFIGILVVIAGLGYLTDSIGKILFPVLGLSISLYTFFGELLLMFWLVYTGLSRKGKELNKISA